MSYYYFLVILLVFVNSIKFALIFVNEIKGLLITIAEMRWMVFCTMAMTAFTWFTKFAIHPTKTLIRYDLLQ